MTERRGLGALEADILARLWAAGEPRTAAQLAGELNGELAYNTVQTVLARLYTKGAVRREQLGRAHTYSPVLDEAGLAAQKMRAILGRRQNSSAVLLRFVDSLSEEEGRQLAAMLDRFRGQHGT